MMTADDLDEHQFAELGEDGFATGPPAATLRDREAEEVVTQPLPSAGLRAHRMGGNAASSGLNGRASQPR